jgi:hypothetical protein
VHEVYLTRQAVGASIEAFDEFADIMRVRFHVKLTPSSSITIRLSTSDFGLLCSSAMFAPTCPAPTAITNSVPSRRTGTFGSPPLLRSSCTAVSTRRTGNLPRVCAGHRQEARLPRCPLRPCSRGAPAQRA